MIVFSCPNCDTEIEVPDSKAGAKATCGECGERLQIPAAVKKTSITTKRPAAQAAPPTKTPPPPPKKAPQLEKRRRPDDGEEDEEHHKPAKKAPAVTKRRLRDDDPDEEADDQDEKQHAKSKKKKEPQKQSSAMMLWAVLGVLVLGGIAAGVYFVFLKPDSKTPPRQQVNKGDTTDSNKVTTDPNKNDTPDPNKVKTDPNKEDKTAKDGKEEEPETDSKRVPTPNEIYQHVLKSCVWIINDMGGGKGASGSGALIDKQNRLVLTNYHVVYGHQRLALIFPYYDKDNKLLLAKDAYMKELEGRNIEPIHGRVLAQSEAKDLAIIQVNKVPEHILPLPIGTKSVNTGEDIHSVGNPGPSGSLWVYTPGKVRNAPFPSKTEIGMGKDSVLHLDAMVIQTNSATYHGDSGGPLVDNKAELVGVTESGIPGVLYATFIDVSEVKLFIDKTCQDNKLTFVPANRPLVVRRKANVQDLVKKLASEDARTRGRAAQQLGEMGIDARLAVSALMKVLKDPDELNRRLAQKALGGIGAPDKIDVQLLREALKDKDLRVRTYASEALGLIGPDARSAGPDLLDLLKKDGDATVRQNAARSVGQIRYDARQPVVAALTEALKDPDRGVRLAAAEALTKVSRADIPLLKSLLKHQDEEVRIVAAIALGYMGRGARAALEDLIAAARNNTDRQVRKACIQALAKFGPDAEKAMDVLMDAMKDEELRPVAVVAFAEMGKAAKPAVKLLGEALSDDNPNTRSVSLRALGRLGPDAHDAVGDIVRLLREGDRLFRIQVLDTLARIGPGAEEAVPELIQVLGKLVTIEMDKIVIDPAMFDRAVSTLAQIGKVAVKQLTHAAVYDDDKLIRYGAITALGDMGYDARSALKVIIELARDRDKLIRDAAKTAYGKIVASNKPKTKPQTQPSKGKPKKPPVKDKP